MYHRVDVHHKPEVADFTGAGENPGESCQPDVPIRHDLAEDPINAMIEEFKVSWLQTLRL